MLKHASLGTVFGNLLALSALAGCGGSAAPADVTFDVSGADAHPISPLIYGTSAPTSPGENRYGLLRSGGNRMTAYNWETNASNAGKDYRFQNDSHLSGSSVPGAALTGMLTSAASIGATAMLTIPIVDYVAGDKNGDGDVRNSGADYLQTRFKQNRAVKGEALAATPDATDAYVNQDEFVSWAKTTSAAGGPPIAFSLDNEPDLWSSTHAEVHPLPVGYDELCTRNVTYAAMVKQVWPEAEVAGFVSFGWSGYITLQNAPDSSGKGDFTEYYLDKMKAAEATAGKRLIDYLDLHWYPEAQGDNQRIINGNTADESVEARVQAPRSLWDTTYNETSWISTSLQQPIRLIPRMRDKIKFHYAGTKLAITEWNYGAGGHISGGVAAADVLGIFGREGVGMAAYWALVGDESFANAAFRAFRNYDGAGAAFGDTSIHAGSSDVATATVYASTDAADPDRVVIVAINKATTDKNADIVIDHPAAFTRLQVWTLTATGATLTPGEEVAGQKGNSFRYTMPPLSVSVLVPGI
jgi:hypothetical protein